MSGVNVAESPALGIAFRKSRFNCFLRRKAPAPEGEFLRGRRDGRPTPKRMLLASHDGDIMTGDTNTN